MTPRIPRLAVAAILAAACLAPSAAAQDPAGADEPVSGAEFARVTALTGGQHQLEQAGLPPPQVADLDPAIRASLDAEPRVAVLGLCALAVLVGSDVVNDAPPELLGRAAAAAARSAFSTDPEVATAAGMLLRAIDAVDRRRAVDGAAPLIAAPELRRLVIGSVDRLRDGTELERRAAAGCMRTFAGDLPGPLRALVVRALLDGLANLARTTADEPPTRTAAHLLAALAAIEAPEPGVAAEVVAALAARVDVEPVDPFTHFSRIGCLAGIARQVPTLRAAPREPALEILLRHAQDPENAYMATSGRLSPPRHAGLDALAIAVPALTPAERERAGAARARLRELVRHPERIGGDFPVALLAGDDGTSMFAAIDAALPAVRRTRSVLLICIDDLRPELGCYGVADADTPHLDRLAAQGAVFAHHYVQVPTCGASRYAMLTGRDPRASGVRNGNHAFDAPRTRIPAGDHDAAHTLPERFRRAGYATVQIGKVSHTPDGLRYGYDGSGDGSIELPGAWDRLTTPYGAWDRGWGAFFAYADGRHREDGGGHRALMEFPEAGSAPLPDELLADAAIAELRALAAADRPFFLAVGFYKPHLPWVAPASDHAAFDEVAIADPAHPERPASAHWHGSSEFRRYRPPFPAAHPLLPAEDRRAARRAYLACVRFVDRQVGRVLAELDALGRADDTVVVVWGDHGWHLGERAIWGKHSSFEESCRSALLLRAPEVPAGRRVDALAASIDLWPTLVDLAEPADAAAAHRLDGVSLAPLLRGDASEVRDHVVTCNGDATSVRTATHRLIFRGPADAPRDVELYDLSDAADRFVDRAKSQPDVVTAILAALGR